MVHAGFRATRQPSSRRYAKTTEARERGQLDRGIIGVASCCCPLLLHSPKRTHIHPYPCRFPQTRRTKKVGLFILILESLIVDHARTWRLFLKWQDAKPQPLWMHLKGDCRQPKLCCWVVSFAFLAPAAVTHGCCTTQERKTWTARSCHLFEKTE